VLASSASAVEVVGLGYQVVEVPAWKVGGVGDVPLAAVPEKDDVFLVGLGGEAQDVPRYQSMAVDLVEGWRPRPDLLQDPAERYVPSLGSKCMLGRKLGIPLWKYVFRLS